MIRSQNTCVNNPDGKIERYIVPAEKRLGTLPECFGVLCLAFENKVYELTGFLTRDYRGGFWDFYRLSNGGFYMAPFKEGVFKVNNPYNYFEDEMNADALGIAVCMMAMSHLSFDHPEASFAEHFYRLRSFALDHEDAETIMRLTD